MIIKIISIKILKKKTNSIISYKSNSNNNLIDIKNNMTEKNLLNNDEYENVKILNFNFPEKRVNTIKFIKNRYFLVKLE